MRPRHRRRSAGRSCALGVLLLEPEFRWLIQFQHRLDPLFDLTQFRQHGLAQVLQFLIKFVNWRVHQAAAFFHILS
jgi:hypothetical protein